jgi:hypothetical protein
MSKVDRLVAQTVDIWRKRSGGLGSEETRATGCEKTDSILSLARLSTKLLFAEAASLHVLLLPFEQNSG